MSDEVVKSGMGFILAGGHSRRLGEDKARALLLPDLTLIEALHNSLKDAQVSWTVIADEADKFDDLGLPTIADPTHQGPLGGIERAAQEVKDGYFFITACDCIGLQSSWIGRLQKELVHAPPAVAFRSGDRWEPLFGFYHTRLNGEIRRCLRDGERAVWRLLDEVGAHPVEAPKGWEQTFSVNTPRDLKRARSWAQDLA